MMWQDLVFLIGSTLSVAFLAPTLRDANARVPLGTSLPSMTIGFVYATTFATLGMTFSAVGSLAAGTMWSLIALVRSPAGNAWFRARRVGLSLFVEDAVRWFHRRGSSTSAPEQYVAERPVYEHAAD